MAFSDIAYEPHPVTPERKRELNKQGFKIIDARFAPDDEAEPDELPSDDEMRTAIEAATGKKVNAKTGRPKLIEQFNAIKADEEARQSEVAANGLTRREIEADLIALEADFDPASDLEDLAALRDLAREGRE